jgi:ABC-type uncharacterized transport system substrate-binding protein
MNFPQKLLLLAVMCIVLASLAGPGIVASQDADPVHVLVVHSYHPEYPWEQELNRGILTALAEQGYSEEAGTLDISYFWMDTKRLDRSEWMDKIEGARLMIRDTQPDVVIVTDNNAIENVPAMWSGAPVPFVFAGLNNNPAEIPGLLDRRAYVTGVQERVHIEQTLNWIQRVLPETDQVLVIADASVTSWAYMEDIRLAVAESKFAGSRMRTTNDLKEWDFLVAQAPAEGVDAIIVGTYSTIQDADGQILETSEVMAHTIENCAVPLVALWEFGVQDGVLGGAVISGETQGYEAGLKAVQIIQGTSPADIEITTPQRGRLALNAEAVLRWDVSVPLDLLELSRVYGADGQIVNR